MTSVSVSISRSLSLIGTQDLSLTLWRYSQYLISEFDRIVITVCFSFLIPVFQMCIFRLFDNLVYSDVCVCVCVCAGG